MDFKTRRFQGVKPTYKKVQESNRPIVKYSETQDSLKNIDRKNDIVVWNPEVGSMGYVSDEAVFLCAPFERQAIENGVFPKGHSLEPESSSNVDPSHLYQDEAL